MPASTSGPAAHPIGATAEQRRTRLPSPAFTFVTALSPPGPVSSRQQAIRGRAWVRSHCRGRPFEGRTYNTRIFVLPCYFGTGVSPVKGTRRPPTSAGDSPQSGAVDGADYGFVRA